MGSELVLLISEPTRTCRAHTRAGPLNRMQYASGTLPFTQCQALDAPCFVFGSQQGHSGFGLIDERLGVINGNHASLAAGGRARARVAQERRTVCGSVFMSLLLALICCPGWLSAAKFANLGPQRPPAYAPYTRAAPRASAAAPRHA